MEKRRKVVFYNGSLRMGGIERVLIEVLKHIDREKYEISLVIEDGLLSENVFEKEVPAEIPITYLKPEEVIRKTMALKNGKKNIFNKILYNLAMGKERKLKERKILEYLEENKPDILIDFDMGLSKVADKIEGIPKITWVHSSIKNWYRKPAKIRRLGERLKSYDRVITICDDMNRETEGLYPHLKEKLHRIYNPMNLKRVREMSEEREKLGEKDKKLMDSPYLLSVMRLTTYQKDFKTLIEAFKLVKKKGYSGRLYILGGGPDRKAIEGMIEASGMQKEIVLLGQKENPYIWMKNAELLVHSSKFEGFGMVLIEAMALGRAVVSTDCPVGPREILEDGKAGALSKLEDPEGLSSEITGLLEDERLRNSIRERGLERSVDFEADVILKEYESFIDGVIDSWEVR